MELFLLGLGLGLAAGISPGPLLTLVVASSLERGFGAGLRVAVAPVLTDAPIILLAILLLRQLPPPFLGTLGVLGGGLAIYLGIRILLPAERSEESEMAAGGDRRDLWHGALVNFLNPHPWLAWTTVMGPTLVQGWRQSPARGIAFVASFYIAIVTSKVAIAWIGARSGQRLSRAWSRRLVHTAGILLVGLGAVLVWRAVAAPL